jgi:hypothetical protein
VLFSAGLDAMFREGIASSSGLVSAVAENPAVVFLVDEIGRILKTMASPSSSPYLFHVVTMLMRLFTSSGSVFKGDVHADSRKNVTVYQPHVCLLGSTVEKSLTESMTAESITDGLLGRMLIVEGEDLDKRPPVVTAPPQSIVDAARYWGDLKPGGNMSGQTPQPIVVSMTPGGQRILNEFDQLTEERRRSIGYPFGALWVRGTEKAHKLALLWACSACRENPVVDDAAAKWACRAIDYLTRRLICLADQHIAENGFDAERKRVLRCVTGAGPRGASRTYMARHLSMKAGQRQEMLDLLVEAGEVIVCDGAWIAARFAPLTLAT